MTSTASLPFLDHFDDLQQKLILLGQCVAVETVVLGDSKLSVKQSVVPFRDGVSLLINVQWCNDCDFVPHTSPLG